MARIYVSLKKRYFSLCTDRQFEKIAGAAKANGGSKQSVHPLPVGSTVS